MADTPNVKASVVEVWKDRSFVILWGGRLISSLGDQIYLLALPWLILELTSSATAVNTMNMVQLLPSFLLGFVIGVYVDRLDRKKVMIVALCIQALLVACIPLTRTWHVLSPGILYIIGFLLGLAERFYFVAIDTAMPVLFKRHRLIAANAQLGITDNVAQILGPGLAGLAIGLVGAINTLILDSFSFVFLALAILLLPLGGYAMNRPKPRGLKMESQEALRWLTRSGSLWAATLGIVALNLFHVSVIPLIIFYARQSLHLSAQLTGVVFVVGSLGSLAAGFTVPVLTNSIPKGKLMLWAMLPMGIAVMLFGVANSWWMLGFLIVADQAGKALWNACYFTIRQGDTPHELLGRIASITSMITKISILALPLWGWLADKRGTEFTFIILGLGILITAGLLWKSPLRRAI
ncbi:MAG TPA: MFS transporter [Ktedonobacteraceae bacterium]|nr:MFS transporter [Ktedonobacteraceae bacterium]